MRPAIAVRRCSCTTVRSTPWADGPRMTFVGIGRNSFEYHVTTIFGQGREFETGVGRGWHRIGDGR